MLFLFLIFIIIKNNLALNADYRGKTFKFDKFMESCPTSDIANFSVYNIKSDGKKVLFDVFLKVNQVLTQGDFEINFERCSSREALDTCKKLQKLKTNNACFLIAAKRQPWSPIFQCVNPKPQCPIEKGLYEGLECSLDLSVFNYIPFGRYYWRIQVIIYLPNTTTKIVCLDFSGQLLKKS